MAGADGAEPTGGRRFRLVRTLGEGTFGSVYLAEMEGAGGFRRRVALKLLNDTWGAGSDAARRLRDEARLLGRLEHRHIVRVDDLLPLAGRWAVVMEYVSGADLERVFSTLEESGARMSPRAAVEVGVAVATALDAAWSAPGDDGEPLHVVHRDIKPSNVRLSEDGDVKVLDFGVARAAFAGREARTERVRYGSLGYMAPERLLGEPDTAAGDVYALGVVLYELLTTKIYGRAELGLDRQVAQVAAARATLVEVLGDTPLVALLERALAYAPDERPAARDLADALRALLPSLPGDDLVTFARAVLPTVEATPSHEGVRGTVLEESGPRTEGGARVSSATLVLPAGPPAGPADAAPPRARRVAWPAVAVGFLVVLAVGVVAVLALPDRPAPAEAPGATTGAAVGAPASPRPVDVGEGAGAADPRGATATDPTRTIPSMATDPTAADPTAADPPAAAPDAATAPNAATSPTAPAPTATPPTPATNPTAATNPTTPDRTRPRKPVAAAPPAGLDAAAPLPSPADTPAAPPAPRLRAAKFTLAGAEGIAVTCGDVTGTGATSTLLREFPAGECTVTAAGRTARVRLDSPRGVACTVEGDTLACR